MQHLQIGDIARLGGASVRMLRHYHEIDLLVPNTVDSATGYRFYELSQVTELKQIVELRSLGVPLAAIAAIRSGDVHSQATVLRRRREELVAEAAAAHHNIERIDQLLTQTKKETVMADTAPEPLVVEIKPIAARTVAQLTATSPSWNPADIGPTIQPLYPELISRLEAAGVEITGPSTARYEDAPDGGVLVHATLTIAEGVDREGLDFEVIELPAINKAACTIHRGTMDNCDETYLEALKWIEANGHTTLGYSRELDIECGPGNEWVTELQFELV